MDNKKQRVKQDYNSSSKYYEKRYSVIQNRKFEILDGADLRGLILDLGGGTGLLGKYLDYDELVNVDISIDMLRQSKEINVCADLDFLPFKTRCFESVLSFTALQNLPSFFKVFKELRRVLKPKGCAVISALSKANIISLEKYAELSGFRIEKKQECGEDTQLIFR